MSGHRFFTTPLNTSTSPARQQVIDLLGDFCKEVVDVTGGKVTCDMLPGFATGFGQEYRATAHSVGKRIDHILFRAYVPVDGLPLSLDFYDEDMTVCQTVRDVEGALAGFATRDETRDTLRLLSQ